MIDSNFLKELETETGFTTFENTFANKSQFVFYGISETYDRFKELMGEMAPNGSIVYLMDTGDSHMYSSYNKTWY